MYPTLVVVLVASRRSVLERSIVSVTLADDMPPRFSSIPVNRQKCMSRDRHSACSSCPTVTSPAHRSSGDEDNRGWPTLQRPSA
ncbi:hypothetical protein PENSPDRAFT_647857 [Peniophora sp. CONT]|nr:hypothetical protein PENSPDRAFT_647857 [Peniophora sp. CONT]